MSGERMVMEIKGGRWRMIVGYIVFIILQEGQVKTPRLSAWLFILGMA